MDPWLTSPARETRLENWSFCAAIPPPGAMRPGFPRRLRRDAGLGCR